MGLFTTRHGGHRGLHFLSIGEHDGQKEHCPAGPEHWQQVRCCFKLAYPLLGRADGFRLFRLGGTNEKNIISLRGVGPTGRRL